MKKILSLILVLTLMCATMLTSCSLFNKDEDTEPVVKIIDVKLTDEEYAFVCKKGNTELRDKIQNALAELDKEGKIAEICTTWFGSDVYYRGE